MVGALAVVLLAVAQQAPDEKNVRGLVARLDADDPAVREAAHQELARLGPAIAPFLEPFRKSGSAETASRVDAILKRFEIDAEFRKRLPDPARVTLPKARRTVEELLRLIEQQTGLRVKAVSMNVRSTVDLGWEGVPILRALDDVCRAMGKGSVSAHSLIENDSDLAISRQSRFRRASRMGPADELVIDGEGSLPPAVCTTDQFRLALEDVVITEVRSAGETQTTATVNVALSAQPGTRALFVGPWEVVEAVDDQGRSLKLEAGGVALPGFGREEPDPDVGEDLEAVWFLDDMWGHMMRGDEGAAIRAPDPGTRRIARLKMKVRVGFALREVSPTLTLKQIAEGTNSFDLGRGSVTMVKAESSKSGFRLDWRTEGRRHGDPSFALLNAKGRPIETMGYSGGGGGAVSHRQWHLDRPEEVAAVRISGWLGHRVIEVPFEFSDVPLPAEE